MKVDAEKCGRVLEIYTRAFPIVDNFNVVEWAKMFADYEIDDLISVLASEYLDSDIFPQGEKILAQLQEMEYERIEFCLKREMLSDILG